MGHRKLIVMTEDFPEDKYNYKPAGNMRSFAERLIHAASANCGRYDSYGVASEEIEPSVFAAKRAKGRSTLGWSRNWRSKVVLHIAGNRAYQESGLATTS